MNINQSVEISIITVTLNNAEGLRKTLDSIWSQQNCDYEHIVIDGGSTDHTLNILHAAGDKIDYYLSEPDLGPYHAMNKGIKLAKGKWLIFMNSGDIFASGQILSELKQHLSDNVDVIYSDWSYLESGRLVKADIQKLNIRHQSLLYRRDLHETYGYYLVGKSVTISDYLFFLSIKNTRWQYSPFPISICEEFGASSVTNHFYQRIASELIFGKRSRINCAVILLLYPFYKFLKLNVIKKLPRLYG